ncbi:predicted protein [Naegleria gruberi]|uniref:Predicted protein n=1 Tax=Naegleria gruberi TaxID=5762 RepID=D2VJC2_NAEGR|nr:uncharacterized protein NAEGRDRAFT_68986 [Naegleria gruberi]EFC43013.1 predicted protein [Naegleria gruberi]|eukprot:XP_002675757.1 predicted protein [Naegleria gruberi strain NEG-M]
MYKIPLRKSNDLKCFNLMDIQGSLETRPEKDKPLDSITLGSLTWNSSQPNSDRCTLVIERQKCEGKKLSMKKPLLICKKVINPQTNQTEYMIVGIAKDKIQFRTRPTPLSPQQQKSKQIETISESSNNNTTTTTTSQKSSSMESVARTLFFPSAKKQ